MTQVPGWVQELVREEIGGAPFAIGDVVKRPEPDGRMVKIVEGQYWGLHGLSNHWTWREVRTDGSLGEEEWGYGWHGEQMPEWERKQMEKEYGGSGR